ncbi:hypothetical protein Tco_0024940 [Tanacetum coccineum]
MSSVDFWRRKLPSLKVEILVNDKANVLEDASKYILQLQAKVKELEETSVKGKGIIHESAITLIGRCNFTSREADGAFLSDDTYSLPSSSNTYKPDKQELSEVKCY